MPLNSIIVIITYSQKKVAVCFSSFQISCLSSLSCSFFLVPCLFRSSRPEVFCKKDVLKISQNSLENTCHSLFLIKLQASGLQYFNKETERRWFSVNFAKFSRIPLFIEYFQWLLLSLYILYEWVRNRQLWLPPLSCIEIRGVFVVRLYLCSLVINKFINYKLHAFGHKS